MVDWENLDVCRKGQKTLQRSATLVKSLTYSKRRGYVKTDALKMNKLREKSLTLKS